MKSLTADKLIDKELQQSSTESRESTMVEVSQAKSDTKNKPSAKTSRQTTGDTRTLPCAAMILKKLLCLLHLLPFCFLQFNFILEIKSRKAVNFLQRNHDKTDALVIDPESQTNKNKKTFTKKFLNHYKM